MRTKVEDPTAWVVNTCAHNDTAERGDDTRWGWANPTNRRFRTPEHNGISAVSTEAAWQGFKLTAKNPTEPNWEAIRGDWRQGKGRRPIGHWDGTGNPPITTPGAARRAIYIPAFSAQIERWIEADEAVAEMVERARNHDGPVIMRDHDTGQGIDRNGPMSHAWLMAGWLNTGEWDPR